MIGRIIYFIIYFSYLILIMPTTILVSDSGLLTPGEMDPAFRIESLMHYVFLTLQIFCAAVLAGLSFVPDLRHRRFWLYGIAASLAIVFGCRWYMVASYPPWDFEDRHAWLLAREGRMPDFYYRELGIETAGTCLDPAVAAGRPEIDMVEFIAGCPLNYSEFGYSLIDRREQMNDLLGTKPDSGAAGD